MGCCCSLLAGNRRPSVDADYIPPYGLQPNAQQFQTHAQQVQMHSMGTPLVGQALAVAQGVPMAGRPVPGMAVAFPVAAAAAALPAAGAAATKPTTQQAFVPPVAGAAAPAAQAYPVAGAAAPAVQAYPIAGAVAATPVPGAMAQGVAATGYPVVGAPMPGYPMAGMAAPVYPTAGAMPSPYPFAGAAVPAYPVAQAHAPGVPAAGSAQQGYGTGALVGAAVAGAALGAAGMYAMSGGDDDHDHEDSGHHGGCGGSGHHDASGGGGHHGGVGGGGHFVGSGGGYGGGGPAHGSHDTGGREAEAYGGGHGGGPAGSNYATLQDAAPWRPPLIELPQGAQTADARRRDQGCPVVHAPDAECQENATRNVQRKRQKRAEKLATHKDGAKRTRKQYPAKGIQELALEMRNTLEFVEFDARVWAPAHLQAKGGDDDMITIVTQCSVDRLPRLRAMSAAWTGKISCAIHIPSDREAADSVLKTVDRVYQDISESCAAQLSIVFLQEHAVSDLDDRRSWAANLYPINSLRNAALRASTTEFVFLLDIDFVPSPGAHESLLEMVQKETRSKRALVVPAVEIKHNVCMPMTKSDVAMAIDAGDAEGFHVTRYPKGHLPTNLDRWLRASDGEDFRVEYAMGYEPYVVARRADVPEYDARFRGYGLNKVVHLYRMAIVEKFEFIVVPTHFVTAREHEPSVDYKRTYGAQRDRLQAARIQALFDIAREEMRQMEVQHHQPSGPASKPHNLQEEVAEVPSSPHKPTLNHVGGFASFMLEAIVLAVVSATPLHSWSSQVAMKWHGCEERLLSRDGSEAMRFLEV